LEVAECASRGGDIHQAVTEETIGSLQTIPTNTVMGALRRRFTEKLSCPWRYYVSGNKARMNELKAKGFPHHGIWPLSQPKKE